MTAFAGRTLGGALVALVLPFCSVAPARAIELPCAGQVPPDDTPETLPGKETFVEVPELLPAGKSYRGALALFEVPRQMRLSELRIVESRFSVIGTPRLRWGRTESTVRFRFRVADGEDAPDGGAMTVCVDLVGARTPDEQRSAEGLYFAG